MTNTDDTQLQAAADLAIAMAAARLNTVTHAKRLRDDEAAFLALVERFTETLDATERFADVAYADLSDAAYDALAARCEELLA